MTFPAPWAVVMSHALFPRSVDLASPRCFQVPSSLTYGVLAKKKKTLRKRERRVGIERERKKTLTVTQTTYDKFDVAVLTVIMGCRWSGETIAIAYCLHPRGTAYLSRRHLDRLLLILTLICSPLPSLPGLSLLLSLSLSNITALILF